VCFANDLSHEQFLTLLRRSKLYLRTPTTDGACASVLESLALKIPVVAAENNRRPASVITYDADDPAALCDRVGDVLLNYLAYRNAIVSPPLHDTIDDEAQLLICAAVGDVRRICVGAGDEAS
jgi:hypothetical protein